MSSHDPFIHIISSQMLKKFSDIFIFLRELIDPARFLFPCWSLKELLDINEIERELSWVEKILINRGCLHASFDVAFNVTKGWNQKHPTSNSRVVPLFYMFRS